MDGPRGSDGEKPKKSQDASGGGYPGNLGENRLPSSMLPVAFYIWSTGLHRLK